MAETSLLLSPVGGQVGHRCAQRCHALTASAWHASFSAPQREPHPVWVSGQPAHCLSGCLSWQSLAPHAATPQRCHLYLSRQMWQGGICCREDEQENHPHGVPPLQLRERIGEEETVGLQKAKARLVARAAQEEELMARVPLSKAERKNLKAQRRAGLSGGVMLDDFADDVADLIQVAFCA